MEDIENTKSRTWLQNIVLAILTSVLTVSLDNCVETSKRSYEERDGVSKEAALAQEESLLALDRAAWRIDNRVARDSVLAAYRTFRDKADPLLLASGERLSVDICAAFGVAGQIAFDNSRQRLAEAADALSSAVRLKNGDWRPNIDSTKALAPFAKEARSAYRRFLNATRIELRRSGVNDCQGNETATAQRANDSLRPLHLMRDTHPHIRRPR